MNNMDPRSALQQYNQVRTHAQIEGASPHRLIQMLMEGALDKIRIAKGFMERRKIPEKVQHINWALSILDGLRYSLDMEKGVDIAQNLDSLYDYMQRRLVVANMDNDPAILDEVVGLLIEIKSAWDALPQILKTEERKAAAQQRKQERDIDARRSLLLAVYKAADELLLGRDKEETSLREMLAINQSVLALSLKMRDEITGSLGALQRGVKANQAYRQNE